MKFKPLIIVCCLWCINLPSFGDTANLYQINLIVIKHISAKTLASEQWSNVKQLPNVDDATQPIPLNIKQFQLKSELNRLKRSKNFQVLLATSWQQQIPAEETPTQIQIIGGTNYNNIQELQGTISISLNRYFTLRSNLLLAEPKSYLDSISHGNYAKSIVNNKFISFQLLQKRRMKSGELNYLDHPLFGLLILITQVNND